MPRRRIANCATNTGLAPGSAKGLLWKRHPVTLWGKTSLEVGRPRLESTVCQISETRIFSRRSPANDCLTRRVGPTTCGGGESPICVMICVLFVPLAHLYAVLTILHSPADHVNVWLRFPSGRCPLLLAIIVVPVFRNIKTYNRTNRIPDHPMATHAPHAHPGTSKDPLPRLAQCQKR